MLKRIMFVVALGLSAALLPGCAQSQKSGAVGCECTGEAVCNCTGKTVDTCSCK